MAEKKDFDGGKLGGGCFSQLLFSDEDVGLDADGCFNYTSSFSSVNPPKMLCFGGDCGNETDLGGFSETPKTAQKSGVTCSDSSSTSSTNNSNTTTSMPKSNKKRNGSGNESGLRLSSGPGAPEGRKRSCKKTKSENSSENGHAKVKKEKLGERITALQQLVSPFGKTDTASVLHEAMGYIRFLQDQVQVLCSPYLQRLTSSPHLLEGGECESRKDLWSRGLCLVPIQCTLQVAETNGADFWSPVTKNNLSSQL
ncbi:unnamed protein product [Ilex paraguariensis]|uniref:BHLH domain-containing protein n=1 Tax=Ilex paraguariensis TaxID=185542 RepID=A0ABC8UJI1_9AQUA